VSIATGYDNDESNISIAFRVSRYLKTIPAHEIDLSAFFKKGGETKMIDTKIPNTLIKLIEKWMDKKRPAHCRSIL